MKAGLSGTLCSDDFFVDAGLGLPENCPPCPQRILQVHRPMTGGSRDLWDMCFARGQRGKPSCGPVDPPVPGVSSSSFILVFESAPQQVNLNSFSKSHIMT